MARRALTLAMVAEGAPVVLVSGDRFEVPGVDAQPVAAQVVDLQCPLGWARRSAHRTSGAHRRGPSGRGMFARQRSTRTPTGSRCPQSTRRIRFRPVRSFRRSAPELAAARGRPRRPWLEHQPVLDDPLGHGKSLDALHVQARHLCGVVFERLQSRDDRFEPARVRVHPLRPHRHPAAI